MRPLRKLLRGPFLVALAALVVASGTAGCDASPYAARVGPVVIKEAQLDADLAAQSSNAAYVAAFDRANGSSGVTVAGDAPGTYSSRFVANVLTELVYAAVIREHLVAARRMPGPGLLAAARAVDSAVFGDIWEGFPASFRDQQAEIDAEHALIEPTSISRSILRKVYEAHRQYFFSRVCVREVAVSVTNQAGKVDYAASLEKASSLQAAIDLGTRSPSGAGGQLACYSQARFEQLPAAVRDAVIGLPVGHAAKPRRARYGYEVLAVQSRRRIRFGADVARALSVAIRESRGSPDPALARLLRAAHVQVDPAYGTWVPATSTSPGYVQPPSAPSARSPAR